MKNNVIHKTEFPGKTLHDSTTTETPLPDSLRQALYAFGNLGIGQKVFSQFIKDKTMLTFIEIPDGSPNQFDKAFRTYAESNEIEYTQNIKGYLAAMREYTVPGDNFGTSTMGSLIAHEIGHTQVALRAFNLSPRYDDQEEIRATRMFENIYRKNYKMPLRKSYFEEGDVISD
ncbi:hypothetical protein [Microbulbifer sp. JTAC008]|uniref:hypothetical protein n=1 Tax=unclassified Microbulbifer TaxID=2619833 RepID=UPI00403A7AEA